MKIYVTSIMVDDQAKALEFYRDKLGFQVKHDIDMGGGARWLTLVSPENPAGTELLLEPSGPSGSKTVQGCAGGGRHSVHFFHGGRHQGRAPEAQGSWCALYGGADGCRDGLDGGVR